MPPTEPWEAYLPEFNAIRQELGPGVATWLASGAMWSTLASMVAEAAAAFGAEVGAVGSNWQGLSNVRLVGAVPPFMGWLATAEAVAAANALAAYGVAEAFAISQGTMVPTPLITQNRISELIAEATNFFGINSGLIALLNGEYTGFWTNNAATMMGYDEAVQLATIPKPITPPPPLANAMSAAAQGAESTAMAAANQGAQAATQAASQAQQPASTAAEAPASSAQSMMSSMLGSGGQLLSAPTQALSSGPQSLTQPLQSMMQPFQSLLGQFGGNTQDAGAFVTGPPSSAFPGANAAFSGTPTGDMSAGGGGAPIASGGGIPAGSMLSNAYPYGNLGGIKSQDVFTGVPSRGAITAANFTPGGAMPAGGGMAPMMHGPGKDGSSSTRRDSDTVLVADVAPVPAMHDARRV